MFKSFKYLLLSLSVVGLFSCTSYNRYENTYELNEEETFDSSEEDTDIAEDTDSESVDENGDDTEAQEEDSSSDDEEEVKDFVAGKGDTLHQTLENNIEAEGNTGVPLYQMASRNTKKVEKKKLLIKPVMDVSSAPYNFSDEEIEEFIEDVKNYEKEESGYDIKNIKVLMDNYKNILQTSSACCISNMTENFKVHGIESEDILSIFRQDSEDISAQDRCMFLSENDIFNSFDGKNVSDMVVKSREICICNNKEYLRKNLDRYGRIIEDNVNRSISNLATTLEACP